MSVLSDDRAIDQGFRTPAMFERRSPVTPELVEKRLGQEADFLADWLEQQSNDFHRQACYDLLVHALAMKQQGPERRRQLKAAIDATRRCFSRAPHPGERDAWC